VYLCAAVLPPKAASRRVTTRGRQCILALSSVEDCCAAAASASAAVLPLLVGTDLQRRLILDACPMPLDDLDLLSDDAQVRRIGGGSPYLHRRQRLARWAVCADAEGFAATAATGLLLRWHGDNEITRAPLQGADRQGPGRGGRTNAPL